MENTNERIVFHANKVEKQMFTIVLPHDEDSISLAGSWGIFGKCKEKISTELYGNVSLEYSKEQLRLKSEVGMTKVTSIELFFDRRGEFLLQLTHSLAAFVKYTRTLYVEMMEES